MSYFKALALSLLATLLLISVIPLSWAAGTANNTNIYKCNPSTDTISDCLKNSGELSKIGETVNRVSYSDADKPQEAIVKYIFNTIIANLLLLGIAGGAVLVAYNGVRFIMNSDKSDDRKKIIKNIINIAIGMVMMSLAYFIVDNVIRIIYDTTSTTSSTTQQTTGTKN